MRRQTFFAPAVQRVRTGIVSCRILTIVVAGTTQWVKVLRTWYDGYLKTEDESAKESEFESGSDAATQVAFAWNEDAGTHWQVPS